MGLLDSFMPGESGGMMNGMNTGLLNGLNSPMAQLGLGILANNQGNGGSFSAAIGKGGLAGLQSIRQQQQLALENQLRNIQFTKANRDVQKDDRIEAAKAAFKLAHPEYADAVDLDPTLAIKAAYPGIAKGAADPYYTPIYTDQGVGSFDNRAGTLTPLIGPDGKPYIKSTDSPGIRGAVKSAEAEAAAAFKPNTDINGVVSTDAQVARGAYGNSPIPFSGQAPQMPQQGGLPNFNTPYPVTFGAPGTTATDRAEGTMTDNLGVGNPARPNVPGIRVPTKAEQAANVKTAEMKAESTAKKEVTMAGVGDIIDQARGILTGKVKPTHSGIGELADSAGALVGYAPQGAAEADALKAVAGQLVSKMPRMEGPQSNFDVKNYQQMAGDVGNSGIPIQRRLNALSAMENIVRKYDKTGSPVAAQTTTYDSLPKNAPKGQIVRNPDTGARMQFDGLKWKPL